jgi:spermidine synthase/tetratricopeptide (TPR) repeat protein
MEAGTPLGRGTLTAIFAVSGASGLVYEVVWMRALRLLVGSTTLSHAIAISAFMAGLALGAWLAGSRADRAKQPLRAYAWIELAIGVYGVLFLFLSTAVSPLLGAVYRACEGRPGLLALGELLLLAPIVLPGSALMGATLPVLGRALGGSDVARDGGRLYAANTLGAAFGAAFAGFVLLPALGLVATTLVAAGINVALGGFIFSRSCDPTLPAPVAEGVEPDGDGSPRLAALAVALSGFGGMTLQIAWTKLFVVSVGSSTFAFTGVVSVYILGIGAGAALGTRALASRVRPPLLLAASALGAGAFAALTPPFFAWLPEEVASIVAANEASITAVLLREVALVAVVLAIPTILLGAVFPLGVAVAGGSPARPGRALARVSSASSLGSIAGALVGGLVLLPWLGLSGALRAGALLAGSAGILALAADARPAGRRVLGALGAAALVALCAFLAPAPDARMLDSGAFLYGSRMIAAGRRLGVDGRTFARRRDKLLHHAEGADLVAAVYGTGFEEYLVINGKIDASSAADAETQRLLGHLPMLLHGPGAKRVCVIGLGSGMTAGAVLTHPGVEHVDLIEISPTVVETVRSSALFASLSHDALDDRRLRLLIADGRTHLRHATESYDVIVSEPTNPWIAGVGDLYTREHFRSVKERLAPDGVFGQWLQGYSTTPELFATIVRTFRSVFPEAQLWRFAEGEDTLIVAKREGGEPRISCEWVRGLLDANPTLRDSLRDAGIAGPETLPWFFALDAPGVAAFAGEGPLNTDDSGYLEHRAPFALFQHSRPLDGSASLALQVSARPPFTDVSPDVLARVHDAQPTYFKAVERWHDGDAPSLGEVEGLLRDAIAAAPPATVVRDALAQLLSQKLNHGEIPVPLRGAALDEIEATEPRSCRVLEIVARAAQRLGRLASAEKAWKKILALRPRSDAAKTMYASYLVGHYSYQDALTELGQVSQEDPEVLTLRGFALMGLGKQELARPALERAIALDPNTYRAWLGIGIVKIAGEDNAGALAAFERAVEISPDQAEGWFRVGFAQFALGDRLKAAEACRKALALDPGEARAQKLLDQIARAP